VTTPHFEIAAQSAPDGVLLVRLAGDFDMAVGTTLAEALVRAANDPAVARVVVDLQGAEFLDSHGVAGLVAGYEEASRIGRRFTVTNAHGMVRRVLDITGLSEVLIDEGGSRR
jgi:anti-sigma B factor antagonist